MFSKKTVADVMAPLTKAIKELDQVAESSRLTIIDKQVTIAEAEEAIRQAEEERTLAMSVASKLATLVS